MKGAIALCVFGLLAMVAAAPMNDFDNSISDPFVEKRGWSDFTAWAKNKWNKAKSVFKNIWESIKGLCSKLYNKVSKLAQDEDIAKWSPKVHQLLGAAVEKMDKVKTITDDISDDNPGDEKVVKAAIKDAKQAVKDVEIAAKKEGGAEARDVVEEVEKANAGLDKIEEEYEDEMKRRRK